MIKVIRKLMIINFKIFSRQPETIFWAVVFPLLLFWVLGMAFDSNKDLKITIGIIQENQKSMASLKEQVSQNQADIGKKVKIEFKKYQSPSTAIQAIKQGKIALFLKPEETGLTYYFDPQNSDAQNAYLILEKLRQSKEASNSSKVIILKAKGTRYIDFFLPGLIAFNLMSSCLWGIGWDLIEIRMKKYLKRLMATPMYRASYLLSLVFTRLCMSAFEIIIILTFAYFYFGMTIEGSIWAFLYLWLLGNLAFSGLAILIGSRTANSGTGNGLINACVMPMMLTSGIFFNYHHFPDIVIPIIQVLPLTILADNIRAVFIESAGLSTILLPSIGLWIIAILSYGIGIKIFKWY